MNETFKQEYIEENSYRNLTLRSIMEREFKKVANEEELLGKDLYDFSFPEILEYYKSLGSPSLDTLRVLNNQFKLYAAYALSRNLIKDNQNHFYEIQDMELKNCVNYGLASARVISRKDLKHISNSLFNASDKFILLALFEGIYGKQHQELINLTLDDFYDGKVKLCTGRELTVSDDLINLAEESSSEYDYYLYTKDGSFQTKPFKPGDNRIIKALWNANDDETLDKANRRMRARISRLHDFLGSEAIMSNALCESGRIEMVMDYVIQTGNDVEDGLRNIEITSRYGKLNSVPLYLLKYAELFSSFNSEEE